VHKHIFAAIITLHKTKTLHVVEEFYGSISSFASRFALRPTWCRITVTTAEATTVIAARRAVTIKCWTVRTRCALGHFHWLTIDDEVRCRNLAATLNEREFERLAFSETRQASLLNRADVHEHIIGTTIDLNEAKALLTIEKFNNSFAGTDDLRWHWWAAWATPRCTEATSATATAISAAETAT
jgi:hypothetical protein